MTNRPVPEAEVRLRTGTGQTPPNGRVIADPEGRYFFAGLAAGTYQLQATKAGYSDGFYGMRRPPRIAVLPGIDGLGLELSEGQRVLDAAILVWKHASISGVVTDEAGEPMVGVMVRGFVRTIVNGRPRFVGSARSIAVTDDRGLYLATGFPPGDYVIAVGGTHSTRPAFGAIVQESSRNVPDFFGGIAANVPGSFRTQRFGDYMLSTPDGLPIPIVSSQTDRLAVYQTTYFPGVSAASEAGIVSIAAGDERAGISIQVRPTPSVRVSGKIVGPAGTLGPHTVQLTPAATGDLPMVDPYQAATSMSDTSGQFTFLAVPPGSHVLKVFAQPATGPRPSSMGDMLWAFQPITVGAADIDGVVLSLRPATPIAGRVVLARSVDAPAGSQLIPEMSVTFDPVDGPGTGSFARSDGKGAFTTGLSGGSYYVSAQPPRGWFVSSIAAGGRVLNDSPIDVTTDALDIIVTVTNAPSRLEVTVRDAPAAVDGSARVMVFPADRVAWSGHGSKSPRFETSRGVPGGYTFVGLPAGDYLIAAVREEHATDWPDPKFLDLLSRIATRVTVLEGQPQSVSVRLSLVR